MRSAILRSLVCVLFGANLLSGDVTLRSKMDYKLGSFLPASAAEAMNKQMGDTVANGTVLRIKGQRSLMTSGALTVVKDQEKGSVTLLDPKGKRFCTVLMKDYADKLKSIMPAIPEAAKQMFENLKLNVKTDKTGKTDVIKGIKVEETLVNMAVEMPGAMSAAMSMNMEMHLWAATNEELARIPALKEIAAYMREQAAGNDPSSSFAKMFNQIPGLGDKFKEPMEQVLKASSQAVLRTQMKMLMPGSAKMMGASNPDEPFMDLTTEMVELSTDPIPDSVFQVPAGYQEAKIDELVQLINPVGRPGPPQQQPPAPPAQAQANSAAPGPVYRVGGGVSAPAVIEKSDPQYSEEDRRNGTEGTVVLAIQVSPEGKAENIRVVRSISAGLDRQAIECVQRWQFKPGMKNGEPVRVEAQIEVNFRLLKKPTDGGAVPPEAQAGGYPAKSTSPVLIRKVDPEFSEEARAAKFQGTVLVSARINTEGIPEDLHVVRSLGMGLDEKAIEAVKQWKFRPGTKDGQPVAVVSTIEVNFRLQ